MGFETYRVRRPFQWDGWQYAPAGACSCGCSAERESKCSGQVGSDCVCAHTSCHCACGVAAEQYAGDVWIVLEGHPRKEMMLGSRYAVSDGAIPSADLLLQNPEYKRLLKPPQNGKTRGRPSSRVARAEEVAR